MVRTIKIISHKLDELFSEKQLIIFDWKVQLTLLLSFISFIILLSLAINQSSIRYWDNIIGNSNDKSKVAGTPKGIRSDDWAITTPFTLSQKAKNFSIFNNNIGANTDALLNNVPARHVSTIFRPQFWGYFFLNIETAYSFYWLFKAFILLLGFFLLLLLLTKNNFLVSSFGAIWLYFSPFIQWWFSTNIPEMIGMFSLLTLSATYLLFSKKKVNLLIAGLFFIISSVNFVLFFYPPFQIPLAYLFLVIVLALYFQNIKNSNELIKKNLFLKIFVILACLIVSLLVLVKFYIDAKPAINAILNTSYPGKRVAIGGNFSLTRLFSGFYSIFMNENSYPKLWNNICEASSFLFLFPVVILLLIKKFLGRKKINLILLLISVYLIALTSWLMFPMPSIFSKITLLYMVPSSRAIIGLGLGGIILVSVFLAVEKIEKLKNKKYLWMITVATFIASIAYGLMLRSTTEGFIRLRWVIVVSLFLAVGMYLFLLSKKKLLMFLILFMTILSTYYVNPINKGLSTIYGSDLSITASELKVSGKTGGKTIVFDDYYIGQYLISSGYDVFNGAKYTPDIKSYKILDPDQRSVNIYNRYARVDFIVGDNTKPIFNLIQDDYYQVTISPCSALLKDLGIKNYIFKESHSGAALACLTKIREANGISFYRYR